MVWMMALKASYSLLCFTPLPVPLIQVNQLKSPVASKCYHVVISINIHVNRRAAHVDGNIGMCAAEKTTQFNPHIIHLSSHGLSAVCFYQHHPSIARWCFQFMARNRHS
jgi:hypothetical protein